MVSKSTHEGYLFDDTPRGILEALLIAGGMAAVLTAAPTLFALLGAIGYVVTVRDRERKKKLQGSFQYLANHKYVARRRSRNGIRLELTPQGRKNITRHITQRVFREPIKRPKVWDLKWRLILFDIPAGERTKRNAFRALIRRTGAIMLQKSVWVHPFDCSEQVSLLKDFFNLSDERLRFITSDSIGNDEFFRRHFKI